MRWLLGEGGVTILDVKSSLSDDPRFGAIWVDYDPFSVKVRLTQEDPALADSIRGSFDDHPFELIVVPGSLSASEADRLLADVPQLVGDISREAPAEIGLNIRTGEIEIRAASSDHPAVGALADKKGFRHVEESVLAQTAVEYGGDRFNGYNGGTCSVGYTVRRLSDNFPGIVTAGHCYHIGSVGGHPLWPEEQELCYGYQRDRQVHPIDGGATTEKFALYVAGYGYLQTYFEAVAGGWYDGQPSYRVGTYTYEFNKMRQPVWTWINGNSECASAWNYGYRLTASDRTQGQVAITGDSGGPLVAQYNGKWFLIGTSTSSNHANGGQSGSASLLSIPSGWKVCYKNNC